MGKIETMSMADRLTEGVAVSIMGFLIVFCVLLVIMIILSIFNAIAKYGAKKAAQQTETPAAPTPAPAPAAQTDDTQLVAVITAAIMAARVENNEGTDGLVVKSIRRVNSWNKEALAEQNIGF